MDVNELIIKIKTNIPGKPDIEFTSDLYHVEENEDEMEFNKYPFFTNSLRFPVDTLKNKTPIQLKRIFFNRNEFDIYVDGNFTTKPEEQNEIVNYNMKVIMELLMPTYFPKENNYNFSYNEYILKKTNNFEQSRSWASYLMGTKPRFSYIKVDGSLYSIIEVTWVNDLINNPTYRNLFKQLYDFENWRNKQITDAETKNKSFIDNLTKMNDGKDGFKEKLLEQVNSIITEYNSKPLNQQTKVPRTLVVEFLQNLKKEENKEDGNIVDILNLFIELKKDEMDAQKTNSPGTIFISRSLNSLENFQKIMSMAKQYAYNMELIDYLKDFPKLIKYMETKKEDIPRQFDKFVYDELKKIRDVNRIQNLIEGFRTPVTNEERDKIQQYKLVSNKDLQDIINGFGKDSKVNENIKNISEYLIKVISNKDTKNIELDLSLLKLGLINEISNPYATKTVEANKEKSEKSSSMRKFIANFQMSFVQGKLDESIIKEIKCVYKNNRLVRKYNNLRNKRRNKHIVYNDQPLINVELLAKSIEKKNKRETKKKGGFVLEKNNRKTKKEKRI